ncbi:hypothetical protein FQR65_LT14994 [Abscondita terminalis]|nr:hypothetical protein FQR65_LT14994 [Abscondita terminalis]
MYIGVSGVRGLHHLVYEVVDNSIDEALAGYCDTITVTIKERKCIEVSDNGRGITWLRKARQAAKKPRMVQRKLRWEVPGLPGKLIGTALQRILSISENISLEGDSAGGTAKQGRDRVFQAILPLRGKILNVEKSMLHKVYDNEEIKNIYTALGVSVGTEEDSKA